MVVIDGEEYLTTSEAADRMGVVPATIYGWRRKGYLSPHPQSPPGAPMYARMDVARAERTAYEAAIRTSGSAKRTSRRHEPQRAA